MILKIGHQNQIFDYDILFCERITPRELNFERSFLQMTSVSFLSMLYDFFLHFYFFTSWLLLFYYLVFGRGCHQCGDLAQLFHFWCVYYHTLTLTLEWGWIERDIMEIFIYGYLIILFQKCSALEIPSWQVTRLPCQKLVPCPLSYTNLDALNLKKTNSDFIMTM